MSLNVERIMTKEVKTCRENDTLQTAARIMWDADCGCVPIVDDADHVVGMITDRDICMATMLKGTRPQDLFVNGVMTRQVHSCRPNDSVEEAERVLARYQIRRLPVTDTYGRLVGIVSLNDIGREADREFEAGEHDVGIEGMAEAFAAVCAPRPRAGATA